MDEAFTQGLVAGFILCFALLFFIGTVLEWRQKRHKDRSWCERRSRGSYEAGWRPRTVYRELPGPDLSEKEAKRYTQHARFCDHTWPGQRNGALVGYLTGKHDAAMMESKLDSRFGFSDGVHGYRRGKLIAEHEALMAKQAAERHADEERRRNPPPRKRDRVTKRRQEQT